MTGKSKIVGVSKTLHFLLPDLVMPIDREYTIKNFYSRKRFLSENKDKKYVDINFYEKASEDFKKFIVIFSEFYSVAKKQKLSDKDVDREGWNSSVPKLIDNAIMVS